jgi:hypothetical protein
MDLPLDAAARALASGDPLGALKWVALRDDAPALALRGIAMAQLGELARARLLLRQAARAFGPAQPLPRARCLLAQAEVAVAARELSGRAQELDGAARVLRAQGDGTNALLAQLIAVRRALLLGQLTEAEQRLARCQLRGASAQLRARAELVRADIAVRRLRAREAAAALERALSAARAARVPALYREVELAIGALASPAAKLIGAGEERPLRLAEVEALLASRELVVDACRRNVRSGSRSVSLAKRPVLFALLRQLAAAWPEDAAREPLIAQAFGARRSDDSHRARLRVEIGRLRRVLHGLVELRATPRGFALRARAGQRVLLLAPASDDVDTALLALLADGEAWSTSALALALDESQRSVQRALQDLLQAERVQALGRGRARRWLTPPSSGFATTLLLPDVLPSS